MIPDPAPVGPFRAAALEPLERKGRRLAREQPVRDGLVVARKPRSFRGAPPRHQTRVGLDPGAGWSPSPIPLDHNEVMVSDCWRLDAAIHRPASRKFAAAYQPLRLKNWSPSRASGTLMALLVHRDRAEPRRTRTPIALSRALERDPFEVDPALVERALRGHAATQNALARFIEALSSEPLSPVGGDPAFDLAWRHGGIVYVAEIKSRTAGNEERQMRLGLGQVLRYRQMLHGHTSSLGLCSYLKRNRWTSRGASFAHRWTFFCVGHPPLTA